MSEAIYLGGDMRPRGDIASRTSELLKDPDLSFIGVRAKLVNEYGLPNVDPSVILKRARAEGRLSSGAYYKIAELLRLCWSDLAAAGSRAYGNQDYSFIENIRVLAESEPGTADAILDRYSEVALNARVLLERRAAQEDLSEAEMLIVSEFERLRSKIPSLMHSAPAKIFLHFYDNGDLPFLWEIRPNDTEHAIGDKSQGGRIGTMTGAQHNW